MSAGGVGVLLLKSFGKALPLEANGYICGETFLDGNTVRVDAVLLKSVVPWSAHACFNSGAICPNGEREGKGHVLVKKVVEKQNL